MKPLYPSCKDCRDNPTHETRQKAVAARPALAWHQCCAKHVPGNAVVKGSRQQAWLNQFHETREIACAS